VADNVGITPGSGATAAADDIGGVLFQRVKVVHGADGTNDGDVAASNPLPTQESGGAMSLLSRILNVLMSPMGFDRSLSRQRVTALVESGTVTTVTTVTTCTTVSSLTNVAAIGGYSAQVQVVGINLTAWAQCMRARIT
jgi:hypothetical protein